MANNLPLKIFAIGIILSSGAVPTAIALFPDKIIGLAKYLPVSNRCEQALPGICEMRCRSQDNCALERVKR
jgi:hypothetical protein